MNVNMMRGRLRELYGDHWKKRVDKMTDKQVIALYYKFLAEKKIKG